LGAEVDDEQNEVAARTNEDDEPTTPGSPPFLEVFTPPGKKPNGQIRVAQEIAELRREIRELNPATHTSESFDVIYEWFAKRHLPKGSAESFDGRVRNHLLPNIGNLSSKTLAPEVLEDLWLRLEKDLGPQTLNHLRNHGKRIIALATSKAKMWPASAGNPFAQVALRKVPRKHRELLTPEECGELIGAASKTFRCMFAMALYYGQRKNEILGFTRSQIDFKRRTLHLISTKTGVERDVPIVPEFEPLLVAQMEMTSGEYLFALDGRRRRRDDKLQERLASALCAAQVIVGFDHKCRKCGHSIRRLTSKVERCPNDCMKLLPVSVARPIDFHGLRHICASLHRRAGCDPLIIRLLLGHVGGGLSLTDSVYTHFTEEQVREHLSKLSLKKATPPKGGGSSSGSGGSKGAERAQAHGSDVSESTHEIRPSKPRVARSSRAGLIANIQAEKPLDVRDVAKILDVSRTTVHDLIERGLLKAFRVSGQFRIPQAALEEYLLGVLQ
jgi:integrase